MNKKITFLTEKDLDRKHLEEVLIREKEKIINMEDRNIIEKILSDFKKQNFPTLSPQEIQFLKLNPEDTWCNYLIFRYKFNSYPAQHIVSDFPNYLLIEPVSACNLRCVMCFQIDESFSANKEFMGKMDFDFLKKSLMMRIMVVQKQSPWRQEGNLLYIPN